MSDERPSDVLGALPRRRPHRRSEKRAAPTPATERGADSSAPAATQSGAGTATTKRASGSRPRGARPANGARPATNSRPAKKAPAQRAPGTRATPSAGNASANHTAQPRRRAEPLRQPAQPAGTPPAPARRNGTRDHSTGRDIVGIAAQAAAELAEIGLSVSARALRNAVGRLPRP
ncbi:MAG TPA: hypothetical protein VMG37_05215 [Solirubrobacteraceae bacterium]|nr:hypothetical protein [Solirubrobacteraceae bacterium]